ncbi:hypothetical protein SLS64_002189 [Diaporthe eres]
MDVEPGNPPEGLQLGQIATPNQIITGLRKSSEAAPLQAQPTASEMGSLPLEDPEPLTARAVQGVDEAVGTGITQSGVPTDATSRTSLESPTSFTGTVEDLGCDEPGQPENKPQRPPYLLISTGPGPPSLSPSSANSGVFQEGLNRLHSFQDLARLRLKHATQIECYETTVLRLPETSDSELYDLRDRRWAHLDLAEDEGGDDLGAGLSAPDSPLSSSPSTSTSTSTFLDSPSLAERRPFSFEAFFDASPESPEGSPTLPRRNDSRLTTITYRHMPPKTMPELSGLGDSGEGSAFLSSTWASASGGSATDHHHQHHHNNNAHLRPRSAPKNLSRTSNPFTGLWGRKGQQHQHQAQQDDVPAGRLGEAGLDSGMPWKRISDDGTAVEVHEGRTTPPRSASGAPNGLKDAKEPANASEGGGPPPLTREEFEALPLAIQRKVRWLEISSKHTKQQRTWVMVVSHLFLSFPSHSFLHPLRAHPLSPAETPSRGTANAMGPDFSAAGFRTALPSRQRVSTYLTSPRPDIPVARGRCIPVPLVLWLPVSSLPFPSPFSLPQQAFWFQGKDVHPIGSRRSRAA